MNILQSKPIPMCCDGKNVRDWLYVAGHNEVANIDLVTMLCDLLGELKPQVRVTLPLSLSRELITYLTDRPGQDHRYAIDASKIETELDWRPQVSVQEGLLRTVVWYLANQECWQPLLPRNGGL